MNASKRGNAYVPYAYDFPLDTRFDRKRFVGGLCVHLIEIFYYREDGFGYVRVDGFWGFLMSVREGSCMGDMCSRLDAQILEHSWQGGSGSVVLLIDVGFYAYLPEALSNQEVSKDIPRTVNGTLASEIRVCSAICLYVCLSVCPVLFLSLH